MFQEIPACKNSLSHRKLIFGVGINDADYLINPCITATGKLKRPWCPYYKSWWHMIHRCYSPAHHKKYPTYKDCTVCDEWKTFTNYKAWMTTQDWCGKQLDKDIIINGNRVYSPLSCCFVPRQINNLLIDHAGGRGKYPQGVSLSFGKYKAQISKHGKVHHIGIYATIDAAENAYKVEKTKHLRELAETQPDRIKVGLLRHAAEYS